MNSGDIVGYRAEIQKLLGDGDLPLAVDRLKTVCHATAPRLFDDMLLLEARLNRLLKDCRRGTITSEAFDAGEMRIAAALLSVLGEIAPSSASAVAAPEHSAAAQRQGGPESGTVTHQMILGINNLKQISWIQVGLQVARSVGRILTPTGGFGTGFLIGNGLLMTNHHVIPDAAVASSSVVELNYQQDASGGFLPSVRYAIDGASFYTTGPSLDCTIVGVRAEQAKPPLDFWGSVVLNANADPVASEHVVVIQHPNGGYKQIVLTANYVVGIERDVLHYTTDTMPGSSGSPVFNDSWQVIAIHHAGGHLRKDAAGNARYVNEGVLMSSIRASLQSKWPQ
jgi:V8-like Glu-specific endopeptidase